MSQRPTVQKPTPLSAPNLAQSADPVMGGVNIPKFGAEMQAEVSPEAAPLWNFVLKHARRITALVVGGVVAFLLIAAWQWYCEKQLNESRAQLGRVISIQDPARRITSLEGFLANAPSELAVAAQLELAVAAVETSDWGKAAQAYAWVAEKEGDSPLGFAARLNNAHLLVRKGDYAQARTAFLTILADAPATMAPLLHQLAGEAAEAAGDKAAAIGSYESAISALPPTDSETAHFFRDRVAKLKK